jgi:hypothetical protein
VKNDEHGGHDGGHDGGHHVVLSLSDQIKDKNHIHLHEGAMEMTVLAFLKTVIEKNQVDV